MPDVNAFWAAAWTVGFPFVLVCMALWLFYTNRIYTKASYDEMVRLKDQDIQDEKNKLKDALEVAKLNGRIAEGALRKEERESRRKVQ